MSRLGVIILLMYEKSNRFQLSKKLRLGVGRKTGKNSYLKYISAIFVVVTAGLGANAIRLVFSNTTESSETRQAQVLGISNTKTEIEQPTTEFETYLIKKGDTLYNIAQNHQISWTTLATLNNIQSPFTVSAGQELKIPKQ